MDKGKKKEKKKKKKEHIVSYYSITLCFSFFFRLCYILLYIYSLYYVYSSFILIYLL